MKKFYIIIIFLSAMCSQLFATGDPIGNRVIEAIRTNQKPLLDGEIDANFNSLFQASEFTTFEPIPGLPSQYDSEVTVRYNDEAIFITAKLYDDDVEHMIKDLSPRDNITNTDYFGVTFDPYRSGITGYSFIVTAAGVQVDAKEVSYGSDESWNDVWRSEVSINEDGWTVEMEIPYSALRFPTGEVNDWNIQFTRLVRKTREKSFWNPVDPAVDGFLTQMGTLTNIRNIDAPLRLSVTPYLGIQVNTIETGTGIGLSPKVAGGMDLKYGINEAFTLDMILVPDFSQVRSDVQVLNLGPFEVQFDENRPFFTEGLELFNTADIFYTRRIGARGHLLNNLNFDPSVQSIESLPSNNLVNATKISGRTNSKTGLGFFNAVEIPTYATVTNTSGQSERRLLNPLTNYNVVVVDQALKNNSRISFINSNVTRVGSYYDANVSALEWNLRNKKEKYDLRGKYVSSQKYYESGPQLGYSYNINAGKISGAWNYRAFHFAESVQYDINDLGFLYSPNERGYLVTATYNKYKPENEKFAFWRVNGGLEYATLFSPNVFTDLDLDFSGFLKLTSFTAFGFNMSAEPIGRHDYFEPRRAGFSTFLYREPTVYLGGFISTDYRKPLALDLRAGYEKADFQGRYSAEVSIAPRIRVNSRIFIVPRIEFEHEENNVGYVFYLGSIDGVDPLQDILMGSRNVSQFDNSLSGQFNITNKMSFNLQVNHYFSTVKYVDFSLLANEGKLDPLTYDGLDDTGKARHNTNYNFFTINAVYTWRFAPGSDLIFSYKSNLQTTTEEENYINNLPVLGDFYKYSGINLKALYFLDVNRLRRKK